MAIKTKRLRKEVKKIIKDQPIIVHRFILLDDGYSDAPSWSGEVSWPFSWIASWQGRIDTLGREVWQVMGSEGGQTAKRTFTLLLPYMESGHPTTNDMIELYDTDGNKLGDFRVNMTIAHDWKTEVNVELIAPGSGKYG
mgnify:CR=1 FL=1